MKTKLRSRCCVLVWVACLIPASSGADWNSVRSNRFELITRHPPAFTGELASAFDAYIGILGLYFPKPAASPLTVLVFEDRTEFKRYCSVGGMATHLDDGRYVIGVCVAPRTPVRVATPVLFHEAGHWWLEAKYPDPFSHGIVQVLETAEIADDFAVLGRPIAGNVRSLRANGIKHVSDILYQRGFAGSDKYTQSWVLVHYLMMGDHRAKTMPVFFRFLDSGNLSPRGQNRLALLGDLQMSEGELQVALTKHVERSSWVNVRVPIKRANFPRAQPAVPVLVQSSLARFAMFQAKFDVAEKHIAELAALDSANPEVAVLRTNLEKQKQRWSRVRGK